MIYTGLLFFKLSFKVSLLRRHTSDWPWLWCFGCGKQDGHHIRYSFAALSFLSKMQHFLSTVLLGVMLCVSTTIACLVSLIYLSNYGFFWALFYWMVLPFHLRFQFSTTLVFFFFVLVLYANSNARHVSFYWRTDVL